jgi:hypothetical protein
VPVVSQGPLARRVFVAGRGLRRLCQPIVQVADPDPHRMAPRTAATVSQHRPEAKSGTLGAGLLQRELSVPTQRAVRHFGVAVMPGTAAVGMLRPGPSVSPSKGVKGRGGGRAVGAWNPRNPTMCRRPAKWPASTR